MRNKKRSRGRMLELISRPDPKIGPDSLSAPDRGAQSVCDWWTPPLHSPYRSRVALSRREAPPGPRAATTTTSVPGQCQWRPEGYRYPRRPTPSPDHELVDPHLADSDFLASILDSIDAMAPAGTSSSAPPPTDGLHPPLSLFSFVLV